MTLARLRHMALSLQAWLIELDYDVVLTGDDSQFVLTVYYHGFNYSERHTQVKLPIPTFNFSRQQIEIEGQYSSQSAWRFGSAMTTPPLSMIEINDRIIWSIEVGPSTARDILNGVVANLTKLKERAVHEDAKLLASSIKRKVVLATQSTAGTRELNRALANNRKAPPKPHHPTRKKYA